MTWYLRNVDLQNYKKKAISGGLLNFTYSNKSKGKTTHSANHYFLYIRSYGKRNAYQNQRDQKDL